MPPYEKHQLLNVKRDSLHFKHLPSYAKYLLDSKLKEFAAEQLTLSGELKIPLLRFFEEWPKKKLLQFTITSSAEMLTYFSKNNAGEFIDDSVKRWFENQLPMISRDEVKVEDITLMNFVRRKIFRLFLPGYTSNVRIFSSILEEIDLFTVEFESRCFKLIIELQQGFYRQAQALSHLGNWTWQITQNKLSWSDEMYRIYDLEPQAQITFEDISAFNHPEDKDFVTDQIQQSLHTKAPLDFYYRIILKDKRVKVVHSRGAIDVDAAGKPFRIFGTLQDITEDADRKKAEAKLKESEEKFRTLANTAPVLIWVADADKLYNYFNKGWLEYTGRSMNLEIGSGWADGIHPEDFAHYHDTYVSSFDARQEFIMEYRLKRYDGEYHWIQDHGIPRFSSKGIFEGYIGTCIDIHDKKMAHELLEQKVKERTAELKNLNLELEKNNSELQSFNYVASHDLQEPLRKIQTYSNRIMEKEAGKLPDTVKDYLQKIRSAAHRMHILIEDLLTFSQTKASDHNFKLVNLNLIFEEVQTILRHAIDEKGADIKYPILPSIVGMPFQLQQLFANVLSNAIKYSKRNVPPQIQIRVGIVNGEHLKNINISSEAEYYKITIKDNGIGFDNKHAERIFEVFQRLHGRHEYSGTGIGLAICKKIVQNHKGYIIADGKVGEGATFSIFLPVNLS